MQLILNFLCLLGKRETNEIEKQPKVKKWPEIKFDMIEILIMNTKSLRMHAILC